MIKKEAQLSIGGKDHLNVKENYNADTTITEYQRRYDSLMEKVKPKDPLLSIYKKDSIARNPKAKVWIDTCIINMFNFRIPYSLSIILDISDFGSWPSNSRL